MSEYRPKVSIVIVTCNSLPALSDCLEALKEVPEAGLFELILVDNASADGSPEKVRETFPDCRIVTHENNLGFAAACNRGAQEAAGEYLLFLNPDVIVDPGAIDALLRATEQTPDAGLVSGRLRFPDGSFQATCRKFPTITNLVFSRGSLFSRLLGGGADRESRYTLPDYEVTTEVPSVAATLLMIRKDLFDRLEGFDSRFFMFMEDTDLSLRASQTGARNFVVPSAGGVHAWGRGSRAGRFRRLRHHHFSLWQYFLKHLPNGFSVIVLPVLLTVHMALSILLPARGKRP
ncbi:MAG: glycosyltransferase family 2 protein [bacterium]|nr:glycosyltransferase family 2 protein [bacterium]